MIPPIPGTRKPPRRYGWGLLVGVSKTGPGIAPMAGEFELYEVRTSSCPKGLPFVLTARVAHSRNVDNISCVIYDNHLGKMTALHTLPDILDRFLIVEFATA